MRGKIQRRAHQQSAVNDILDTYATSSKAQINMACGTGKTLIAYFVKEDISARLTTVFVPSLFLISQVQKEWSKGAVSSGRPFQSLFVCSDETVNVGSDDIVITEEELAELGGEVTSNVEIIRSFMIGSEVEKVVFCTFHSSPLIAQAVSGTNITVDFAFIDEAHKLASDKVETAFSTILNDELIPCKRKLFSTATPRIYRSLTPNTPAPAHSMCNKDRFGVVAHTLSMGEAIERGLLADFRVVVVHISQDMIDKYLAENVRLLDGGEVISKSDLINQLALTMTMIEYDLKSVVTFHSRVADARSFATGFADVYQTYGDLDGKVISTWIAGKMKSSVRAEKVKLLAKASPSVLSNARCLTEGVDIPSIDAVMYADPRKSDVDIVQSVGRAIRLSPNKTVGTVIIPLFHSGDYQEDLVKSKFRHVWNTLNVLRSNGCRLSVKLLSTVEKSSAAAQRAKTEYMVEESVEYDARTATKDILRHLKASIVNTLTAQTWQTEFERLQRHLSDGMGFPSHKESGHSGEIGRWCQEQRKLYQKSALPEDRILALESLDGWVWNVKLASWDKYYQQVRSFIDHHSRYPNSKDKEQAHLVKWLNDQRKFFARGTLGDFEVSDLEALPYWFWDAKECRWYENYWSLVDFVEKHQRLPRRKGVAEPNEDTLGAWVSVQKNAYHKLSVDNANMLHGIPCWTWGRWLDIWLDNLDYVRTESHKILRGYYASVDDEYLSQINRLIERIEQSECEPNQFHEYQKFSVPIWNEEKTEMGRFVREGGKLVLSFLSKVNA